MYIPQKFIKSWKSKNVAVIVLKIEHCGFTTEKYVRSLWMELQTAKTLIRLQPDQGQHRLARPVCPNT